MKLHEFSRRRLLGCAMGLTPMTSALAQFRLEVVGVGMVQLPIAVLPFKGETAVHPISGIVQADLLRSGQFGSIESSGVQMDETTRLDASLWRQRGADALLSGSLTELADGRFELRARLWDVVRHRSAASSATPCARVICAGPHTAWPTGSMSNSPARQGRLPRASAISPNHRDAFTCGWPMPMARAHSMP